MIGFDVKERKNYHSLSANPGPDRTCLPLPTGRHAVGRGKQAILQFSITPMIFQ
jgi:hypothetical protein